MDTKKLCGERLSMKASLRPMSVFLSTPWCEQASLISIDTLELKCMQNPSPPPPRDLGIIFLLKSHFESLALG